MNLDKVYTNTFCEATRTGFSLADAAEYARREVERLRRQLKKRRKS